MYELFNCRVEINDKLEIYAWDLDYPDNPPFLYQPDFPNGTPFKDETEALEWVTEFLKERAELANKSI